MDCLYKRGDQKLFNDPVYDHILLDPPCLWIIDTPEFQRLSDLKQLGVTNYVFSSAKHTRFEHSLGASHMAHEVAERIYHEQGDELGMEPRDVQVVAVAGLCHDLGHGPFSHAFEHGFLKALGITDWNHEAMSCTMLDHLIDSNHIDGIAPDDARLIKSLILGKPGANSEKMFLYDVVANHRNEMDVDKMDYLKRDAMSCNMNISCNFKRLLNQARVLNGEICYKWSEYDDLYQVFHSRALMHKNVYTHKTAKAVELMVVDAMLKVNGVLGISDKIREPEEFILLNDTIINTIEGYGAWHKGAVLGDEAGRAMEEAQALIRRIRHRDLYSFCGEYVVPYKLVKDGTWGSLQPHFTAETVASCYGGSDVRLNPADIIVNVNVINFAMGEKNPLDQVHFFDDWHSTEVKTLAKDQVMTLGAEIFQERTLRVYSRRNDPAYTKAAQLALDEFTRRYLGPDAKRATPNKVRPVTRERAGSWSPCNARVGHAGDVGAAAVAGGPERDVYQEEYDRAVAGRSEASGSRSKRLFGAELHGTAPAGAEDD